MNTPEAQRSADRSLATLVVRVLFDRQGVPDRKRSKVVQEVLGISYQAAHRRIYADGTWSLDDLEQLASRYGESLADLFLALRMNDAIMATFVVGAFRCPCRAWLGTSNDAASSAPLVAREEQGEWIVSPGSSPLGSGVSVRMVTLEPQPVTKRFRVAFVDDERETVVGACAYLTEVGFDAQPFMSFSAMRDAMKDAPYDAYIFDWWVGPETALQTIAAVRASDAKCPIGVITGQIQTGRVPPNDVATVIQTYGVSVPFEKPLRAPILAAWLHHSLPRA